MPHDDYAVEPVNGLPERPPRGEVVLWQGRPDTWALAKEALGLLWVAGYFGLLALWRVGASAADVPFSQALGHAVPFVALGAATCLILYGIAWVQARMTVYTITTDRVAMRIGAALTVTVNLPFAQISSASLDLRKGGTGTVALHTKGDTRLSYLVLWPHVRPWHAREPEPALRCIPDAQSVARIVAEAAETRISRPTLAEGRVADAVPAE